MQNFRYCFHFGILILVLSSFVTTGLTPVQKGNVRIKINLVFNDRPFVLNTNQYITQNGDSVSFDQFRFYLSSVYLHNSVEDKGLRTNNHFLIDANDPSSQQILLKNINLGKYTYICLNIGVDSIDNVSGAMNGALDPAKGMYWTWNTGYINAKLQGTSLSCNTLHHAFEFHIGGYTSPFNTVRRVKIPLQNISISSNNTSIIELNADVAAWFKQSAPLDLSLVNNIVTPGKAAMMLADNYSNMFSQR